MTPSRMVAAVQQHLAKHGASHLEPEEWTDVMLSLGRLAAQQASASVEVFVSTTLDVVDGKVVARQCPTFLHEAPGPIEPQHCI